MKRIGILYFFLNWIEMLNVFKCCVEVGVDIKKNVVVNELIIVDCKRYWWEYIWLLFYKFLISIIDNRM